MVDNNIPKRTVIVARDETGTSITIHNWIPGNPLPVTAHVHGGQALAGLMQRFADVAADLQAEGIAEVNGYVSNRGYGPLVGFEVDVYEDPDPRTFVSRENKCPVCGHDLKDQISRLLRYGCMDYDDCPTCGAPLSVDLGPMPATITSNFLTVEDANMAVTWATM